MQVLPSRARPESDIVSSGDNSNAEQIFDTSGIDDVSYLKLYLDSSKEDYKLISYVNSKISLLSYLKKNNITLSFTHKDDWAYKANCPFKDHRDSSPSFYVNIVTNSFHCFGCSRKGGICQFLACLNDKTSIDVAKELLENGKIEISDLIKEVKESYINNVSNYLDEFANIHHSFLESNEFSEEAFDYASKVAPVFELYVKNILKNNGLNLDSIKYRLDFCKRKFEEFEEQP